MLGALSFAFPWALLALAAVPILWWLLAVLPPRPRRITFPPLLFLLQLRDEEQTANHSPWWLLALRLLIVTFVIIALSGPQWHRAPPASSDGPLLLIIDNGWASAHNWQSRIQMAQGLVDAADQNNQKIVLLPTALEIEGPKPSSFLTAREAAQDLARLTPKPWIVERATALQSLRPLIQQTSEKMDVVWLSNGLAELETEAFLNELSDMGAVRVATFENATGPIVLSAPDIAADRFVVELQRPPSPLPREGRLRALDSNGNTLSFGEFTFASEEGKTTADIVIPLELRNRVSVISVEGQSAAAATFMLDERWRRRSVGIVAPAADIEKPLLSEIFYLEKALSPFASLQRGALRQLIDANHDIILMPDQGVLSTEETDQLGAWINRGGTLVRFASARMGADTSSLTPVMLRGSDRALGGALSWDTPQELGPFPEHSPFSGLTWSDDVTVSRQILAEPSVDLNSRTWAQLSDGTPIVTAQAREQGWLILFHTTANAEWSNLPMSGLFVSMLRRIIDLSVGTTAPGTQTELSGTLTAIQTLDGFGNWQPSDQTLGLIDLTTGPWKPSSATPPGIYGTGPFVKALNLSEAELTLSALDGLPSGFTTIEDGASPALRFAPYLFVAAFLAYLLDGLIVLWVAGALNLRAPKLRGVTASLVAALVFSPLAHETSHAQPSDPQDMAMEAALTTRLAYVKTGLPAIDGISRAGLEGLTETLRRRTAADPGLPFGVDLARDDLSFYPLLYFPVRAEQPLLTPQSVEKLNAYMARGGTLLVDSGDHQLSVGLPGAAANPDSARMGEILRQLDVPPLVKVPTDHVLTKSFYLIQDYPGRWQGGALWVEANEKNGEAASMANDGVSSIVVGSNDFAAAWAVDAAGRPRFPLVPGGPSQREGAMRFGVNLVMYTLTGNYKADQVHVPALLERLGQ